MAHPLPACTGGFACTAIQTVERLTCWRRDAERRCLRTQTGTDAIGVQRLMGRSGGCSPGGPYDKRCLAARWRVPRIILRLWWGPPGEQTGALRRPLRGIQSAPSVFAGVHPRPTSFSCLRPVSESQHLRQRLNFQWSQAYHCHWRRGSKWLCRAGGNFRLGLTMLR